MALEPVGGRQAASKLLKRGQSIRQPRSGARPAARPALKCRISRFAFQKVPAEAGLPGGPTALGRRRRRVRTCSAGPGRCRDDHDRIRAFDSALEFPAAARDNHERSTAPAPPGGLACGYATAPFSLPTAKPPLSRCLTTAMPFACSIAFPGCP